MEGTLSRSIREGAPFKLRLSGDFDFDSDSFQFQDDKPPHFRF